jgi:hypothetical protein
MATEKHEVLMHDGRKVIFGKVEKMKKAFIVADGAIVGMRFDCANGESAVINATDIPDTLHRQFFWHGVSQKHGDEYSGKDSPSDCMATLKARIARTMQGEWASESEGFAQTGVLFEACVLAYPDMTPEGIREVLAGMSPKERKAFEFSDEMQPWVLQVQKERMKGVDMNALKAKFQPKAA